MLSSMPTAPPGSPLPTGSALRVSVRDYSRTIIPRPRPIDVGAFRGRGLHLVAALSQSWGVHQHSEGKTIWINLQLEHRNSSYQYRIRLCGSRCAAMLT